MSKPSGISACQPEKLTLFHYGELDPAEHLRVKNHLKQCPDCRREIEQVGSMLEMLPKEDQEISPQAIRSLNERVSRRLRSRLLPPLRPVMGGSLAAAAVLVLTVTLYSPTPEPQQPLSETSMQAGMQTERLPEAELLMNLDLLENLDLLQELEGSGAKG
ncbi:MAG TPA: zf-HC2 domain-containing protein [Desulfuromonadales bacterium]|nr:zf-HC2 domain-containing protein [Desulfuromonadales bacterium]